MFDPENPNYFNRDRFVMSAGHGSALLYATMHLSGYPISLDDLKKFRQIDSITPGHPEYGVTPGVDATTGPLGQGIAMAVGMAMAEANLEARFNKGKREVINHYTYVLCGDGDLMEGISYEACSLAGSLHLNKLIVLYDSNDISLDGKTSLTFNENISMRFISQGWNVITVADGDNISSIDEAIKQAKTSVDKPTLIEIKTIIGKYSSLAGTSKVHGSPLSKEEISDIKNKLGIRDIPFAISNDVYEDLHYFIDKRCNGLSEKFNEVLDELTLDERDDIDYLMGSNKSIKLKEFAYEAPDDLKESPRDTSHKVLNITKNLNYVLGGSADLFSTNKTFIDDGDIYSSNNYLGKNIYFGVREHAMGAIINGLALHGFRSYASTFLSFSDYMKPALREAALMNLSNIYIFTHDSITVGEDGPTHEPIEQLLQLRSIPNFEVFRPADANEVIGSYLAIFEKESGPAAITLSRNKLPILSNTKANEVARGGYILYEPDKKPNGIVISSGEEVYKVMEVAKKLQVKGINIRVVSMPNLNRFLKQDSSYIQEVLPVEYRKIAVEASSSFSWKSIIFDSKYLITQDSFGLSGKCSDVEKRFGFDVDSLEERIETLLK